MSHRKKYTVYKKATENYFIPLTLSRRKYSNYFAEFDERLTAKYKTLLQFFPEAPAGSGKLWQRKLRPEEPEPPANSSPPTGSAGTGAAPLGSRLY